MKHALSVPVRVAIGALVLSAVLGTPIAYGAFEGTASLPIPAGEEPSEPYLAINPIDANNVVVVSHLSNAALRADPAKQRSLTVKLAYWSTADGGASWLPGTFLGTGFEGQRALGSDPVVAFGPDGTAYYAGMALPYRRSSWQSLVVVGRSTDGGRSFDSGAVLTRSRNRGSILALGEGELGPATLNDKEWIATDRSAGPFRGSVYVAWDKVKGGSGQDLLLSRQVPGQSTFDPPARIARGTFSPQISVRPDGTLDLLWAEAPALKSGGPSDAPTSASIMHAFSADGGATFSPPQSVASLKRTLTGPAALATSGSGRLLACWPQIALRDIRGPGVVSRSSIFCSSSADGTSWSLPLALDPGEPGVKIQGLPAAAAQGDRFWVTTYAGSKRKTRVLLYRSDDGGSTFVADRTLAARNYGPPEGKFVGDYTGLAATGDRVIATYVLSARGRSSSPNRLFVTSVATQ